MELENKDSLTIEDTVIAEANTAEPSTELDDVKVKDTKKRKATKDTEVTKETKKKITPGVIYLSKVPTKMNVKLIREYFTKFGQIDRIFLEPQEKKRKNQPRSFSEGWVEFKKRRIAKQVATDLNSCQVGGKRRNPWFSELWNIKYLKNFRWTHLNERMAYEQEIRKQRLRQETTLAKKEANFYIQNVEKNEKKKRFERKLAKNSKEAETENQNQDKKIEGSSNELNNKAPKTSSNDDDDVDKRFAKNKHPVFERKVKVTGNDTFLKQIFS